MLFVTAAALKVPVKLVALSSLTRFVRHSSVVGDSFRVWSNQQGALFA
jgi:hypothetical protein